MASCNDNVDNKPILRKIKGLVFHNEKEKNLRIVVLGYHAVGKTALIIRCLTNQFYNNYVPEQEQAYQHILTVGQKKVKLDIIDTKGKNNALISHADAVLLVFSITDFKSFEHVKELISKVRNLNINEIPIIIIANKIDKGKQREVSKEKCERLSQEYNLKVFELSAAIPTTNIDAVFEEVYRQIHTKRKSHRRSSSNSTMEIFERKNVPLTEIKRRLSKSLDAGEFIKIIPSKSPTYLI